MIEHPPNARSTRTTDRTHNSRRHGAESRPEESRSATRAYRGGHRAEDRVGRHHAERP